MKITEKLEMFSKLSLEDAQKKRDAVRQELDARFDAAREELRQAAEARRARTVEDERRKLTQMRNREALSAATEAKRSLIDLRAQLMDDLFEGVSAMVTEYVETPGYAEALAADIRAAQAQYPEGFTASVRAADLPRVQTLLKDIELEAGDDAMIGGFRAKVAGKRILIDNSYSTKLAEARENFQGFKTTE